MKCDTRISLVRSPHMSLDMSRLLDIIGGQVQSEHSSGVPFPTAFFDLVFATQIGFASHPLKTPAHGIHLVEPLGAVGSV